MQIVAKLSFNSLMIGNIVMSEEDVGEHAQQLVSSGLIFKCKRRIKTGYQFMHLIFVEVLAGLHIYLERKYDIFLKIGVSSLLWNSLSTAVALFETNIDNVDETTIIKQLCHSINEIQLNNYISLTKQWYIDAIERYISYRGINEFIMFETLFVVKDLPQSQTIIKWMKEELNSISFKYHHHVKYIVKLFKMIPDARCDFIRIEFTDKICSNKELKLLKHVLATCTYIDLYCSFDASTLSTCVTDSNGNLYALKRIDLHHLPQQDSIEQFVELVVKLDSFSIGGFGKSSNVACDMLNQLSKTIIKANNNQQLMLRTILILDEETFMLIAPCLHVVMNVNIHCIKVYLGIYCDDLITDAIKTFVSNINSKSNIKSLCFKDITTDSLQQLQPAFKYIERFKIGSFSHREDIHSLEPIIKVIESQINDGEDVKLRKLLFRRKIAEESMYRLLDIIDEIDVLRLTEVDIKWCDCLLQKKKTNRKLKLDMKLPKEDIFDENKNITIYHPF